MMNSVSSRLAILYAIGGLFKENTSQKSKVGVLKSMVLQIPCKTSLCFQCKQILSNKIGKKNAYFNNTSWSHFFN